MMKYLYVITILLICSCQARHYEQNSFTGVYEKKFNRFSYHLNLHEDGSFSFDMYIYGRLALKGQGDWEKKGNEIFLDYVKEPPSPLFVYALSSGWRGCGRGIREGRDTLEIVSHKKLKFYKENVTLTKR